MKRIAGLLLLLAAIMVGTGRNVGLFVDGASPLTVAMLVIGCLLLLFHGAVLGFWVFRSCTASQPPPPVLKRLVRRLWSTWWLVVVAVATVGEATGSELTAVSNAGCPLW